MTTTGSAATNVSTSRTQPVACFRHCFHVELEKAEITVLLSAGVLTTLDDLLPPRSSCGGGTGGGLTTKDQMLSVAPGIHVRLMC